MRILAIIGTRPEAVKMLPLVKELKKHNEIETLVCFSGQHENLADNVFELFKIVPDYRFGGLNQNRTLKEKYALFCIDFSIRSCIEFHAICTRFSRINDHLWIGIHKDRNANARILKTPNNRC